MSIAVRSASLALLGGFLLAACGGGGGGSGGGSSAVATLAGSVTQVNGSTSGLGGIRLFNPNSGKTVTTATDGSFSFGTVPAGTITVRLAGTAPAALAETEGGDDGVGGGDAQGDDDLNDDQGDDANDTDVADDGDDHDTGDDDFDTTGVTNGEAVVVHLTIRNGVIETVEIGQSHADDRECAGHLSTCTTSDDPDAGGSVRAESRTDRQRLVVEIEHATAGRSLKAVVIRPDGAEASLGTRAVGLDGRAEWSLNTANGDVLPFGVTSAGDLVGFEVEVRDAANAAIALVCGKIPDLPQTAGDGTHVTQEGREGIPRVGAPVGAEAHVEVEHRTGHEAGDRFAVEVEHMTVGAVVNVTLESPTAPGTYVLVGTLTVGVEGRGEFELSTRDGDTLPFGVTSASSLVGLHIRLESPTSTLLFSGIVPALVTH